MGKRNNVLTSRIDGIVASDDSMKIVPLSMPIHVSIK